MKTTGITRRIDELGRIVIPKELRKNMHIKSGELLEIYLSSSDTISLKKYSILNREQDFIYHFIKILSKKVNCDIFVTSLDKVIFSTKEDFNDLFVSTSFEEQLKSNIGINNINKIILFNDYIIENNFKIFPISPNGDICGTIIFDFKDKDNTNNKLVEFFANFLEDYLESY